MFNNKSRALALPLAVVASLGNSNVGIVPLRIAFIMLVILEVIEVAALITVPTPFISSKLVFKLLL